MKKKKTNSITDFKLLIKYFLQAGWLLRYYAQRTKGKRYDLDTYTKTIKVNLGCGLKVSEGHINIDYNIACLFKKGNTLTLTFVYWYLKMIRYSLLKIPNRFTVSRKRYIQIIQNNKFIFHSLLNGIPFQDCTVDCYYSSHMIGFSFPQSVSAHILKEVYRTLKPDGLMRLSLIDGDYYWSKRGNKIISENYETDDNCFSYNEIESLLTNIGFSKVSKLSYGNGSYPDIKELDDYTPEVDLAEDSRTLYIEAFK